MADFVRKTIGDFYEQKSCEVFGFRMFLHQETDESNNGISPDIQSLDRKISAEVKASYFKNGGIIRKKQLDRFSQKENMFYFLWFHEVYRKIKTRYPTEKKLATALKKSTRSCHVLPVSVVNEVYNTGDIQEIYSNKRKKVIDTFVKVSELAVCYLYYADEEDWAKLGLDPDDFSRAHPQDKVFVTAEDPETLDTLLSGFNRTKM